MSAIFVTVGRIIQATKIVTRLAETPLSSNISNRLLKIGKFFKEENTFFEVVRDPLILKFGEIDPATGGKHIGPGMPNWTDYVVALSPMMAELVTFPFPKTDVKDLPNLSAVEIEVLDFMLTGFEEEDLNETEALAARAAERQARLHPPKSEPAQPPVVQPIAPPTLTLVADTEVDSPAK